MKKIEKVLFCLLAGFAVTLAAKEEILFQSDFIHDKTLRGWADMGNASPPNVYDENSSPKNKEHYQVVTEDGHTFLKTANVYFGISHKLSRPLTVDDSLRKLTVSVTLFKEKKYMGSPPMIVLSSRKTVVWNSGQAFEPEKDSGIYMLCYGANSQLHNYIGYRVNGQEVIRSSPPCAPYAMLPDHDRWVTVTLVYDNVKKQLLFYNSKSPSVPLAKLYNVKMEGVAFNSIWLPAWAARYENIRVTADMK
ncbi:MAG: hypothetical protein BWY31_03302 [Lentisphaerae bacterium ADurb.Bin242]|nr:MAG: hypothetical protein BWY31_03302 [Lentisphaerae bacterium ADurb.Bin242]